MIIQQLQDGTISARLGYITITGKDRKLVKSKLDKIIGRKNADKLFKKLG